MELTEKYRPKKFDDVIGNDSQINILKNFIKNENRPHTYLFSGAYGTGKTTLARIFLKGLGCNIYNIEEINSSNNRGIETARRVIDNAQFKPLDGSDIRAYIMDECHRWTRDYQEAILKVLEEPPQHVYFVLVTTDSKKLLNTILSRCIKIDIQKSSNIEIIKKLKFICKNENKNVSGKILKKIADTSEGHVRDSIKLLEKVIDIDDEEQALHIASSTPDSQKEIIDLCRILLKSNSWNKISEVLKKINDDPEKVRHAVLGYMNSVLLNSGNSKAAIVIENFEESFYNSGKAGLSLACFGSIN